MSVSLAIIGELDCNFEPHAATNSAIEHSLKSLGCDLQTEWISSADLCDVRLEKFAGLWIAPGSPYKDLNRAIRSIRIAREQGVPCFGTCGGFQHMILEYAWNVLEFPDANHAEYDPYASNLLVSKLECSLLGQEMQLELVPDSTVCRCYGTQRTVEKYYCNFGVNPNYASLLRSGPLRIVGSDSLGEIRVIEIPEHPFFVGTLYVPQARSTPHLPHPLITAFLRVVLRQGKKVRNS